KVRTAGDVTRVGTRIVFDRAERADADEDEDEDGDGAGWGRERAPPGAPPATTSSLGFSVVIEPPASETSRTVPRSEDPLSRARVRGLRRPSPGQDAHVPLLRTSRLAGPGRQRGPAGARDRGPPRRDHRPHARPPGARRRAPRHRPGSGVRPDRARTRVP